MVLKNTKGMSLIEIIIVSSIMLIVASGVSHLLLSQSQIINRQLSLTKRNQLNSLVTGYLRNHKACENSLKGINPNSPPSSWDLKSSSGSTFLQMPSFPFKYDEIFINSLSLLNPDNLSAGETGIMILSMELAGSDNKKMAPLEVPLSVSLDATGRIDDCSAGSVEFDGESSQLQCYKIIRDPAPESGSPRRSRQYHCDGVGGNGRGTIDAQASIFHLSCKSSEGLRENTHNRNAFSCAANDGSPDFKDHTNRRFVVICCKFQKN